MKSGTFDIDLIYSDWIDQLKEDIKKDTLSDYDSYFYIIDKNLGLATFWARYYHTLK